MLKTAMKIKLYPQCKLCKLFRQDKILWIELHNRVLDKGVPQSVCIEWLNSQVRTHNARNADSSLHLIEFSRGNFHTHFTTHFSLIDSVNSFLNQDEEHRKNIVVHPIFNTEMLALSPVSEEVRDFKRTLAMVTAAEDRLYEYDKKLHAKELHSTTDTKFSKGKDIKHITLKDIQLFQRLVKELMGMKKDLAVVQNKTEVAGTAVREAVEQLSKIMLESLQEALIQQKNELSRVLPGSKVPDDMSKLVKSQIGEVLKDELPALLSSIYKRYSIR